MTDREKYIRACMYAIHQLTYRGSNGYVLIDDGNWIDVPWKDVLEWLDKEYQVKEVPSGKWICESKGRNYADYHCSVCGQKLSLCGQDIHERMSEGYSLYCDRCGAMMVEEQQGENE